jgi:uncharacterized delta-60 repeat protein
MTAAVCRISAAAGDVDLGFSPIANDNVRTMVTQVDGKIVLGGDFTSVNGVTRNHVARINADGTLDPDFNPNVNGSVLCVAVQPDGRIVVGGLFSTIGGVGATNVARLTATGALDTSFAASPNNSVYGVVTLADGRIVIGGVFTSVGSTARNGVARLLDNGAVDSTFNNASFNPSYNNSVYSLILQADGKIIAGGSAWVGGFLIRFLASGTLETNFPTTPNGTVYSVAGQADGGIIVGGTFSTMNSVARSRLARLNPDGTLDASFAPTADQSVDSVVVQTDGKILVGGIFTKLGGVTQYGIGRLNGDGSIDTSFNANLTSSVKTVSLQGDGRVLIGGAFGQVGGATRTRIARLANDPASQFLSTPSASAAQWMRGGSSPEAQQVSFDVSTNGGTSWTSLGSASRINGGWEKSGLSLPASGYLRSRARTPGGNGSGSIGLAEATLAFGGAVELPEIAVEQPAGTNLSQGGSKSFGAVNVGNNTSLTFTIKNLGLADLTGLTTTIDGVNAADFTVTANPSAPIAGPNSSTSFTVRFTPGGVGPRSAVLHLASNDADESSFDLTLTGTATTPEIAVEQPVGTNIPDAGTKDFGSVSLGSSASLVFTIKNTGTGALTGLTVTKDGTNAADFTVTASPTAPVNAPTGTTTFTVRFMPPVLGTRTAAIHIASNDLDESSFDITLTGTGTPSAIARLSSLTPSTGYLNPEFDGYKTSYTLALTNPIESITLRPSAEASGSSITLNGTSIASSATSAPIPLNVGSNPIVIYVIAPDGVSNLTYTINAIRAQPAPGDVDVSYRPVSVYPGGSYGIFNTALQPDGKLVIGGGFSSIASVTRNSVARLNADGSLDAGFNPNANGSVACLFVQGDGKILIGGSFTTVGGTARNSIARLNSDGTLDTSFNPNANNSVSCLLVQPDGKIVIGGNFTTVGGTTRNRVARLNANGTLDSTFNPNVNNLVNCVLLQPDGKVFIGGRFTTVGGITRGYLARLNADGSLDTTFTITASSYVECLTMQADGKMIVGGSFSTVGGVARVGIARLQANGTLDTGFNPNAGAVAASMATVAIQSDGRILVGGSFNAIGAVWRESLARIEPDGTVDLSFDPKVDDPVSSINLLPDGKIIIAGSFFAVGGLNRNSITRLTNGAATESLTVASAGYVRWARTGTSPETREVTFELSTDGGTTWTLLGPGTRGAGCWEGIGLNLPTNGRLRARARVGDGGGSSGVIEAITAFAGVGLMPEITVEQPSGTGLSSGSARQFGTLNIGESASLTFTIRNVGNADLTDLTITRGGANPGDFTVTASPTAPLSGPDGSTTFTVRFAPTDVGIRAATLHIASNDADENPFDILLNGTGTTPEIVVEQAAGVELADGASRDFGTVNVGSNSVRGFTIKNTGTGDLTGLSISKDGPDAADFVVWTAPAATVSSLTGSTAFVIGFFPSHGGSESAVLHLANNDLDESPFDIVLTGTATAPEIVVEAAGGAAIEDGGTADWGTVNLGTILERTFTIRNIGNGDLTGLTVTIDGPNAADFGVIGKPVAPVSAPNGTTTLRVNFGPSAGGLRTATLHIASNDPDEGSFDINLSGNGLGSSNANLAALAMSIGPLNPAFSNSVTNYAVSVANTVTGFTVTPTSAQSGAVIRLDGTAVPSGTKSNSIGLGAGGNLLNIAVTAQDGITTKTYTVAITRRPPATGDVEVPFTAVSGADIEALAVQPNDTVIFGRRINPTLPKILNPDGSSSSAFPYIFSFNGYASTALVQKDGRVIIGGVFGTINNQTRNNLARFEPNGMLDLSFDPNPNGYVLSMSMLDSGKVVMAGWFNTVAGINRPNIARLNADGSLDTSFHPNVNGFVYSTATQADGKIVIGGYFTSVDGVTRNRIARLNSDGTLDAGFNPNANAAVTNVAVQADGKLVIGGEFTAVSGVTRNYIARLNLDGSLDLPFDPNANKPLLSTVIQANGKIVIGGYFTTIGGVTRRGIARLNRDGTLETAFDPDATGGSVGSVTALALQADGKIVAGGDFRYMGGADRANLARLVNETAVRNLSAPDASRIQWLRDGASPEAQAVTFEVSTDAGGNWTTLGSASRIEGGWEMTGLSLPSNGQLRASARTTAGINNGSSGLLQSIVSFSVDITTPPTLVSPTTGTVNKVGTVNFTLPEAALPGSVVLTYDDGILHRLLVLASSQESAGSHHFDFDPTAPMMAPQIAHGVAIPDGIYTVTLSYQDALGAPAASVSVENVRVDTTAPVITLLGANPQIAAVDSEFIEPGAAAMDSVCGAVVVTRQGTVNTAVPGNYTLSYSAIDDVGNTAVTWRTVQVPHTQHADWRGAMFGEYAGNMTIAGDLADPNGNGMVNLLEYALLGDPLSAGTPNGQPTISGDDSGHALLSFACRIDGTLTYTVQGADLPGGPWTDLARSTAGTAFVSLQSGVVVMESGDANSRSVTVQDAIADDDPTHPSRFLRLQVER